MRHTGRLRRPRHASCAEAWPTGKPTARVATTSACVWSNSRFQAVAKWYAAMAASRTAATRSPVLVLMTQPPRHSAATAAYMVPGMRRRVMLGKTYGPTYAVTSSSSGSWSWCSSLMSRRPYSRSRPRRAHLLPAGAQVLGEHARLGDGGHEVRVAVPPRQRVQVDVPGDARAGRAPEVHPDVDSVGCVRRLERGDRLLRQGHHRRRLVGLEVLQLDEATAVM